MGCDGKYMNIVFALWKSRLGSIIWTLPLFAVGSVALLLFTILVPPPIAMVSSDEAFRIVIDNSSSSLVVSILMAYTFGFGFAQWIFSRRRTLQMWTEYPISGYHIFVDILVVTLAFSIPFSAFNLMTATLISPILLNGPQTIMFFGLIFAESFGLMTIFGSLTIFLMFSAATTNARSPRRVLPWFVAVVIVALSAQTLLKDWLGWSLAETKFSMGVFFRNHVEIILQCMMDNASISYYLIFPFLAILSLAIILSISTGMLIDRGLETARCYESLSEDDDYKDDEPINHYAIKILRLMFSDMYTIGRPLLIATFLGLFIVGSEQLILGQQTAPDFSIIPLLIIPIVAFMECMFIATCAGKNTLDMYREAPFGIRFYFMIQIFCASIVTLSVSVVSWIAVMITLGQLPPQNVIWSGLSIFPSTIILSVVIAAALLALFNPTSVEDPIVLVCMVLTLILSIILSMFILAASLSIALATIILVTAFSFTLVEVVNR